MPQKTILEMLYQVRRKLAATLLSALLISVYAIFNSGAANAQDQTGKSAPAAQGAQRPKSKQIFLSGKNDSARGSSVTIRSDTPLNDYSAYRSGDRFYVVIPKANANSVPRGGSGRGFSDMQVQQRGNDVVLSYRVQPGAKPRVNQRFDRLDVVFDTAEGVEANTAASNPNSASQTSSSAAATTRNNSVAQTTPPARVASTPSPANNASTSVEPSRPNAGTAQTGAPGLNATAPSTVTAPTIGGAPIVGVTPAAQPTVTPGGAEQQQLAQAQPPAASAPVTIAQPSAAQSPGSSSFAVAILRNWPALIGGLLLMGLVLFVLAQRSASKRAAPPVGAADKTAPATVKEVSAMPLASRTSPLSAPISTHTLRTEPAVDVPPPVVAAVPAVTKAMPAETVEEESTTVERRGYRAEEAPREAEAPPVESPAVAASSESDEWTSVKRSLLDEQVTDQVAPLAPADAERVQEETVRLLAGESYDKSVLGGADMMARQMVAAELLAALAGRNSERRQRARAAFVEHGFFNEMAHDLHFADAPAERASAARSLALVGDRLATSHLVAALADQKMEVRRACVEALAELRDPKAAAPLRSLLEREKESKTKVPRKLIERAVAACEQGSDEAPPSQPAVTATTPAAMPAAVELEDAPEAASQAEAEHAEAAPPALETTIAEAVTPAAALPGAAVAAVADDETPTLVATETPAAAVTAAEVEESVSVSEIEIAPAPPVVEPPPPLYAGESLAIPTEEISAATEELAVPAETLIPTIEGELEFEPHHAEAAQSEAPSAAAADIRNEASETPLPDVASGTSDWIELDVNEIRAPQYGTPAEASTSTSELDLGDEDSTGGEATSFAIVAAPEATAELLPPIEPPASAAEMAARGITDISMAAPTEMDSAATDEDEANVPESIAQRLLSEDANERAAAITDLGRLGNDVAFHEISAAFDDSSTAVRSAAARSLYQMQDDRAEAFTRALREAAPERRRNIGAAIASSGLANEAIGQLTGASRDKTYEAFSLLFLMAKAGEVHPLIRAIESHPDSEVRLAVVKLLALSGQKEILPAFRRLAVRGSLPTEVRSAVMEAIYQISSSSQTPQEANS